VREGALIEVATLQAEPGSRVELRDVLLLADGDKITVGNPMVADAVVVAEVVEHGKGKKVINFKFKAKVRYRRKRGHRQGYTKLAVREIRLGAASTPTEAEAAAPRRRTRAQAEPTAEEAPAAETPAPETSESTPAPARRRRTRAGETQE
jgi:large subunit ribosomal protein L21